MLRASVFVSILIASALLSASSAIAATVNACGTLQALVRPNPPQSEGAGSATIDGKKYGLSSALSTNGTNTIGGGVDVGKRVCLSGEIVAGTTDMLNNYVLAACDQAGAPSGCGTAAGSALPSTATVATNDDQSAKATLPRDPLDAGWILAAALVGAAALGLLALRRLRHDA